MKIVFLGTSGSMPTQGRGSASLAIRRKGELIIFDCGEGTQRRMVEVNLGFRRKTQIYITHLHGDHVLGLPGLIQTMNLLKRERALRVYGPIGLANFVQAFNNVLSVPRFPIEIHEIASEGVIQQSEEYKVLAVEADHDVPGWSFIFHENPRPGKFNSERAMKLGIPVGLLWKKLQRGEEVQLSDGRVIEPGEVVGPKKRGLKIAYSGDTRPNIRFAEVAEGADLLIHEATFDDSLLERAKENGHSTASQAAEIAIEAGAKRLILTHISSRYPDPNILLEEAKAVFPNTGIAEDLLILELR